AAGGQGDGQVMHCQQRGVGSGHWLFSYSPRLRRWGLSASPRPSPIRLMASTVNKIAMPGQKLSHHASRIMVRPAPIMKPQLIMLRSPRPRNDSAASVRIAVATMKVAETIIGAMALG